MYARISTYRVDIKDPSKGFPPDHQRFIDAVADTPGLQAIWSLAEEGNDTTVRFFSLWESKEHAENASQHIRPRVAPLFEEFGVEASGPPEVMVLKVEASQQ